MEIAMKVEPYVTFNGRCDEAIEFYKTAVGAKVEMLMRFKECPEPPPSGKFPPELLDKVMHSSLRIGDSIVMATDGGCPSSTGISGISLTLTVSNDAEAERRFTALAEGGKVTMPLAKTFFASSFGMLTDRFGVSWMVITHA
jgi:PhnB protein